MTLAVLKLDKSKYCNSKKSGTEFVLLNHEDFLDDSYKLMEYI